MPNRKRVARKKRPEHKLMRSKRNAIAKPKVPLIIPTLTPSAHPDPLAETKVNRGRNYWGSREYKMQKPAQDREDSPTKVSQDNSYLEPKAESELKPEKKNVPKEVKPSMPPGAVATFGTGGRSLTNPRSPLRPAPLHTAPGAEGTMLPNRVQDSLRAAFVKASDGKDTATLQDIAQCVGESKELQSWPCLLMADWAKNLQLCINSAATAAQMETNDDPVLVTFDRLLSLFCERCRGDDENDGGILLRLSRAEADLVHELVEDLPKDKDQCVLVENLRSAFSTREGAMTVLTGGKQARGSGQQLFEALDTLGMQRIHVKDLMWWFASTNSAQTPNTVAEIDSKEGKATADPTPSKPPAPVVSMGRLRNLLINKWDTIVASWRILDKNNDRRMTFAEFQWGLDQSQLNWIDPNTRRLLFRKADADGNGVLSFTEFKTAFSTWLHRGDAASGKPNQQTTPREKYEDVKGQDAENWKPSESDVTPLEIQQKILDQWETLRTAWRVMDNDNDNTINLKEFKRGIRQRGLDEKHVPDTMCRKMWDSMDFDLAQDVNFKEFKMAFEKLVHGPNTSSNPAKRSKDADDSGDPKLSASMAFRKNTPFMESPVSGGGWDLGSAADGDGDTVGMVDAATNTNSYLSQDKVLEVGATTSPETDRKKKSRPRPQPDAKCATATAQEAALDFIRSNTKIIAQSVKDQPPSAS
uniref:EF-hand domain-containing protein n=1 Tax=Lotharella globosa TaxID=91324 RepID=A0A7S4E0J1_9EUKA